MFLREILVNIQECVKYFENRTKGSRDMECTAFDLLSPAMTLNLKLCHQIMHSALLLIKIHICLKYFENWTIGTGDGADKE